MADDMVDVPTMEDDDKALEDEKPTSDADDDDNKHNGEEKKVEEGTTDEKSDVVEEANGTNGQFASNNDTSPKKEDEVKDDKEDEDEPKEKLEQKVSIISVSDLASELNTYQIVDTRTRAKFIEGHIPGSYHMEWEDWTYRCPKRIWNKFGLGRPTLLSRVVDERHVRSHHRLQLLKLNTSKPIVVVGEPFEWGADGRVAWNLLFWGCADVCLLDGGYPKWEKEQKDHIETGILSAPTLMHPYSRRSLLSTNDEDSELTFDVNYQDERRATTIDVHMLMARDNDSKQTPWYPLLIDTRSKEEYDGTIKMPNQRRIGRIAKSVNIPASKLYHKDGTFISKDELHELLLEVGNKDGSISEDEHAIAYCTAGVRSGLLSVLAEALLGLHIKNYDASLWEWACNPNNLMETGDGNSEEAAAAAEAAYDGNKMNQVDSTTDVDDIIGDLKGKKSEDSEDNGEE